MKIAEFKIEEWMNKYESLAKYDLSGTCISPMSINDLCSVCDINLEQEFFNAKLSYGEIQGSKRLKNAISSLYNIQKPENITVTHGAIGANQLVFLSLLEANDEVISIIPTYQQHYSIPESLGAKVKLLFLKEENNWLPDLEELKNLITSNTKLICLNNPNNPTGAVIPDSMLEEIVEIASSEDIWILSDEAYRGLNLIGSSYSKSIADIYSKGISVGSMSKTYSLPGLRVGWVAASEELIQEINHQREYNTISISILDDYLAAVALENKEKIAERNFKIMNSGLSILKVWVEKEALVECVIPTGGTTALVKYLKNIPSRVLCRDFQEKYSVALLPGETLEMEGYVRIGFCSKDLKTGLEKFSEYLLSPHPSPLLKGEGTKETVPHSGIGSLL